MKKILFALSAILIVALASCNSEKSSEGGSSSFTGDPKDYNGDYTVTSVEISCGGERFDNLPDEEKEYWLSDAKEYYEESKIYLEFDSIVGFCQLRGGSGEIKQTSPGVYEAGEEGNGIKVTLGENDGKKIITLVITNSNETYNETTTLTATKDKNDSDEKKQAESMDAKSNQLEETVIEEVPVPVEEYVEEGWYEEEESPEGGQLYPGEYLGKIDGKTAIVMEVTSAQNGKIFGNMYYPNSVKKYGKTSQTLMPFSGEQDWDGNITLIVKSPTDATYGEDWSLFRTGQYVGGTIHTSKGNIWSVGFDLTDEVSY